MPHADPEARKAYMRGYRKKNPDKFRNYESKRDPKAKPPEKKKDWRLKNNYGITLAEYNEMLHAQGGRCAICHSLPARGKMLAVDHDHKTNKVRGLLCDHCNWMLGHAKDNKAHLAAGIVYLEEHGE